MEILDLISRWAHVGTVIVLVGGTFFLRLVLFPVLKADAEQSHDKLIEKIRGRWRKVVGPGIGLILLSGVFNLVRALPKHEADGIYHAVFGVKFLLAFAVFFLSSALIGRSPNFEPLRKNTPRWLTVNLLLAAAIVALSGFLRFRS